MISIKYIVSLRAKARIKVKRSRLNYCFMFVINIFFLTGCISSDTFVKFGKVIMDPNIEMGPVDIRPSKLSLNIYTASSVNKNFLNEPSPLTIRVLALKSDHLFYGTDFFTLTSEPEVALGKTLIKELDESLLTPGDYTVLGPYELPKGTKQLAVLGEFIDIQTSSWRTTIKVDDTGIRENLLMLVQENEIRIIRKEN